MKMLTGRSLKDIGVREDRIDCKPCNKFKLSTVHREISEKKSRKQVEQVYSRLSLNGTQSNGHLESVPAFLYSL